MQQHNGNTGNAVTLLILYWTYVALPLAWGIWMTVQKSLPLFR